MNLLMLRSCSAGCMRDVFLKLKVEGLLMYAYNSPSYSSKTAVDRLARFVALIKSDEA